MILDDPDDVLHYILLLISGGMDVSMSMLSDDLTQADVPCMFLNGLPPAT